MITAEGQGLVGRDQGAGERPSAREGGQAAAPGRDGALSGVPAGLPALARALKLQQKASKVGFDWNDPKAVIAKIREETDEIEAELDAAIASKRRGRDRRPAVRRRQPRAPPRCRSRERAARTNLKFERRFAAIEDALAARGQDAGQMRRSPRWTRSGTAGERRRKERPLRSGLGAKRLLRASCAWRRRGAAGLGARRHAHRHADWPSSRIALAITSVWRCSQLTPGAVGRIEHQIEHDAPRREPRLDRGKQRIDPLPGQRRHQHRPALRAAAASADSQPRRASAVEPVDLVPDFDDAVASLRLDAELAQHVLDVLRLRLACPHARRRGRAG